jgi:hypothetical protein
MRLIVWTLDMEQAVQAVKAFSLADCAKNICHALIITHGVNDRLASPDDAHKLCTVPARATKRSSCSRPRRRRRALPCGQPPGRHRLRRRMAGGELVAGAHPGVWRAVW